MAQCPCLRICDARSRVVVRFIYIYRAWLARLSVMRINRVSWYVSCVLTIHLSYWSFPTAVVFHLCKYDSLSNIMNLQHLISFIFYICSTANNKQRIKGSFISSLNRVVVDISHKRCKYIVYIHCCLWSLS